MSEHTAPTEPGETLVAASDHHGQTHSTHRDEGLDSYDLVLAQSFPASDPPPLCAGVGGAGIHPA